MMRRSVTDATLACALALMLCLPGAAAAAEKVLLDRIVAVVNDGALLQSELEQRVSQVEARLRQQGTSLPAREALRRQVLERMIITEIQLQRARQTGINVSGDQVNQAIADIARQNGLTLDQLVAAVRAEGMSFEQFRAQIKDDITLNQLRQRDVGSRINVSEREVRDYLENLDDERPQTQFRLRHLLIAVPEGASPEAIRKAREKAEQLRAELVSGADFARVAVAESDGQQALEGGDLGWRTASSLPSFLAQPLEHMSVGDVSDIIRSASGFHVLKLVDRRGGDRTVIEETNARHILIRPDALTGEEQARDRLYELRRQILAGADFAELAAEVSEDPTTAEQGGALGWLSPGAVVERFQNVMDGLPPGGVSEPFRTEFGWHLVKVEDRRQRDATREARLQNAREAIFQRKLQENSESWLRRLREEAYVEVRLDQEYSG